MERWENLKLANNGGKQLDGICEITKLHARTDSKQSQSSQRHLQNKCYDRIRKKLRLQTVSGSSFAEI